MAKLIISDLAGSKALDSKAMGAVRGGNDPFVLALNAIATSTNFASANFSAQEAVATNSVGPFNFGVVDQNNTQVQVSNQQGNTLSAAQPVPVVE
jgi:hypothetical protein